MRRLRAPLFLFTLMASLPALAQGVQPEDVKLDAQPAPAQPAPAEAPAAAPAAPAAPAPAAPAAAAGANAQASVSVGANANTSAEADSQAASAETEKRRAAADRSSGSVGGPVTDDNDTWKMGYSGYFRAPMRFGMGKRDQAFPGQSSTTFHSPQVPDDQYLSWQHTNHSRREWAEMFFSYGNNWAKGVLSVSGYNFTDASAYQNGTQFGIGQGWLEVTPYMPWENVRIKAKAGAFWNRYGQAGRWDAGEYDTYLFGRTHTMGENVRMEIDLEDQPMTIGIEQGFGAKRPDASVYNTSRYTLVAHGHVDMLWDQSIFVGLHLLHNWSQEEARFTGYQPPWVSTNPAKLPYQGVDQPDGKLTIFGGEVRFDMPDLFGYLYLGASYIKAKNAVTVGPATEVIHSYGGGDYNMGIVGNYLESEYCRWNISTSPCSRGNGNVLTVLGQYEAKVGDLLGQSPFGDGQDLTMKLYGMWNKVGSEDMFADGVTKLKVGTDWFFDLFPVLGLAARFDYLAPNSKIKNQNFMIFSPRVVFRSQLVTHEQIMIQYSRYMYKQRECVNGPNTASGTYATPADVQDKSNRSQGTNPTGGAVYPAVPGLNPDWVFTPATADEIECAQPPPSTVTPDGWGAMTESQDIKQRGMPYTGNHLRPDVNVITIEASMWW